MNTQDLIAFVRKNPVSVGCGVLAVLLGAAIYFRGSSLPGLQAQLAEKSAEGERLATNIKNAQQLSEQFAAVSAALAEIEPRIVRPGELARNLGYFYKLQADTGIELDDLRQLPSGAGKPKGKGVYAGVAFAVGVKGEYPAVLEFLRRLESGTYFCRILSLSFAPASGSLERGGPVHLTLSIELLGQP